MGIKNLLLFYLSLFLLGCNLIIDYQVYKNKIEEKKLIDEIYIEKISKIISGRSMEPMIQDGDKVFLEVNYYYNNKVKKGDIIAYDFGLKNDVYIKIVKVDSKDSISFSGNKLLINEKVMINSIGSEYSFSDKEKNMINLYIKDNHIPIDSFLIFGDNVNISIDSRKFGAVSSKNFLGKFLLK